MPAQVRLVNINDWLVPGKLCWVALVDVGTEQQVRYLQTDGTWSEPMAETHVPPETTRRSSSQAASQAAVDLNPFAE